MHYNELLSNTGGHYIQDVVDIMNNIASFEESWGLVSDICFSFAIVIIIEISNVYPSRGNNGSQLIQSSAHQIMIDH